MTITSRVNRATMDGNGVSTTLAIDFPFHSVEDLIVIETIIATGAETTKVLNTDYTVGGAQDDAGHFPDGGEITFTTPPASTVRMVVYRDPPMLQGVVLQETGKIPVKAAIESPLDKLTMIDQRLSERIDRALRLSDGDSLEMGRLPVKGVRASRYLGFDGDGNPTVMTTPQGVLTPISQLTESLIAALPAAGAAGTLRKITDGVRGVWMDSGAVWYQLSGDTANVKSFGAKGDGVTNDTTAVQSAIDSGAKEILFPPGEYVLGNIEIENKTHFRIIGHGAAITWTGTAGVGANIGFQLMGTCSNVTIEGLTIEGDGVVANGHAGVWMHDGQTMESVKILRNRISNVCIGVSFSAFTGGSFSGGIIAFNEIDRVVGTSSGLGYGIHLSKATGIQVFENRINDASRHAIYHAAGDTGSIIHHNIIANHRLTDHDGGYAYALVVSRSSNVIVAENVIKGHYDGGIEISHVTADAYSCASILVIGNHLLDRQNNVSDILVGEQAVPGSYETTHVFLIGNEFFNDYAKKDTNGDILVFNGRQIVISENTFKTIGVAGTMRYISIGHDAYISADDDCTEVHVTDNKMFAEGSSLTDIRVIDYAEDICGNTSRHTALRNIVPVTATRAYFNATRTNPTLHADTSTGHIMGVYTAADTTPSVRNVTCMVIANAGAVTIAQFDDGEEAQVLTLIFTDANTTVQDGASIQLAGGANFTSAANKTLVLAKYSTTWFQIGGSTN